MRILGSVVTPSTAVMATCNAEIAGCGSIGPEVILLSGTKPYFFKSLRINLSAACLFRRVWTSTSSTSPSASTARQR
jgi:hypothetical protein